MTESQVGCTRPPVCIVFPRWSRPTRWTRITRTTSRSTYTAPPVPAGSSVNTADSAVRVAHVPAMVVSSADEKSSCRAEAAVRVLRARLLAHRRGRSTRRTPPQVQVRTVDHWERIRAYNFRRTRIADHRRLRPTTWGPRPGRRAEAGGGAGGRRRGPAWSSGQDSAERPAGRKAEPR
ncbi:peptide chain release factor-like protein [Kocuria rhizophila]|nr:peptide chain release factor-like protein [Kocuria rhizophila]